MKCLVIMKRVELTFLNEYLGEEITQHSYELKEEDVEGERLKAVILEVKEEIIGGMEFFQVGALVHLIWTIKNV